MIRNSWTTGWQWLQQRAAAKRSRTIRLRRRGFRHIASLEALESRELLSATDLFGSAIPLTLESNQPQLGSISQTPAYYSFNAIEDGRLIAEAAPTGGNTRLSLFSFDGDLLMQSDGQSPTNPNDLIDLHVHGVTGGLTYYLKVEGLSGAGSYTLSADFETATAPFDPLPVGAQPWDLTTGDFNGDGVVDLASANPFEGNISVMLGRGDGTFAHAMKFTTGKGAWEIVAADFNGDGWLDLATPNLHDVTVSVLLGHGDGTFGKQTPFTAGLGPRALSVADFDGDGKPDLGVATSGSGLVLLRGHGDGTFDAPMQLPGGFAFSDIVMTDLNGDGRRDIAATNNDSNNVSVLLRQSDETFAAPILLPVGVNANQLIARDFNGDGVLDLATPNTGSDDVSVLLGRGDGTFLPEVRYGGCPGIYQLTAGDFNHDGQLDLATVNLTAGTISILLGRGDGTFADAAPFVAGDGLHSIVTADFDGDGSLDLASGSLEPKNLLVFSGRGDGTFQPGIRVSPGSATYGVVTGDFNGDGRLDLAAGNHVGDVSILLGQGDGTFQSRGRIPIGIDSLDITSGDYNGDGRVDLAVASLNGASVLVLFGRGDGTFRDPVSFAVNGVPLSIVTGDFNGDGLSDLATSNTTRSTVSVLLGRSDGTFEPHLDLAVGFAPYQLALGDFNGDGQLDLATSNLAMRDVSVLLGRGNGTFDQQIRVPVGTRAGLIAAGDFNGDGRSDLVIAPAESSKASTVSVLLAQENGAFVLSTQFTAAPGLDFLMAEDFDGDGHAELIVPVPQTNQVTQYRRQADGSFQSAGQWTIGAGAFGGVAGDFNDDGHTDLATGNQDSSVSVLLNQGDGRLHDQLPVGITSGPVSVTQADFNHDSARDLVTVNPLSGNVEISFGNGDGSLQTPIPIKVGGDLRSVATGDFNQDGRPDIVVVDDLNNTVSILLGIGAGAFEQPLSYPVGLDPVQVITGDFNRDGIVDLATSDYGSGTVSILLGRGDGTFAAARPFGVGAGPVALSVCDFNRDGQSDLVVANSLSRSISILTGIGGGMLRSVTTVSLTASPSAVATGDINSDGQVDIIVANQTSNSVSVLLGRAHGTFQAPMESATGAAPVSLVLGDFNGDGHLDVATANNHSNDVTILLGKGDGTFVFPEPFAVGSNPLALLAGDFNNDDRLDIVSANGLGQPLSLGLGFGDGTFVTADRGAHPIRSTPLVGDLNGDGRPDVAVLAGNGQILVRLANTSAAGTFQPPIVLNPDPQDRVRDLTLVTVHGQQKLAALAAGDRPLSFYSYAGHCRFVRSNGPVVSEGIPVRIVAGDLNGDGRQDLIVASSGDAGKVVLFFQQSNGTFGSAGLESSVGKSLSDLALVNLSGGPGPDIVIADQYSGVVHVLQNTKNAPFSTQFSFRTGTGLYSVWQERTTLQLQSREAPVALVSGAFDADSTPDVLVLNSGSDRLGLLRGDGHGGVYAPENSLDFRTGPNPSALATGDFNRDGVRDVAVLSQANAQVLIYLGDGRGGFVSHNQIGPAGQPIGYNSENESSGITVADVNGDGLSDLLIGSNTGDILTLLGHGDGTFMPYRRVDRHVALAIADLNNDQQPEFVFADQSLDRIRVQFSQSGQSFEQQRQDGVLDPRAIKLTDLNGDGFADMIVANGDGDEVLVYPGEAGGAFGSARHFFVGTEPTSITVGDLNADGLPDLVVTNRGSNDLSILLGQGQNELWTLQPGPRLRTGTGPVATVVEDLTGDGIADILVANHESNNVYLLAGLGRGFFNDRTPTVYRTGTAPVQLFVGQFDSHEGLEVVTINAGSNNLTILSRSGRTRTVSAGATDPVAALANDFNHDGLSDLIMANRSGQFSLWLGGSAGAQLTSVLTSTNLSNVSELALGRTVGNTVEVYLTTEGTDTAVLVTLVLNARTPVVLAAISLRTAFAITVNGPVVEFSSPSGSRLEIVPTLTFDFGDAAPTAQPRAVSQLDRGEPEPTDASSMAHSDADPADIDRNVLITGAAETPVQQHLNHSETTEFSPADIPFLAPWQLFEASAQHPQKRPHRRRDSESDDLSVMPNVSKTPVVTAENVDAILAAHGQPAHSELATEEFTAGPTPDRLSQAQVCAMVLGSTAVTFTQTPRVRRPLARLLRTLSARLFQRKPPYHEF